ncbi:glycosyltransferase [Devosia enhydra]|nr:glycosyltransferase [Devosia enhydra]
MTRRVAIAAIGTMGDVAPFVALSLALQKRGFSVVLGTSADFEEFVEGHGVEFHSLGSNIQNFLRMSQFESVMSRSSLLHMPVLLREGQKILKQANREVWTLAQGADAIVFHMNTTFAIDVAEVLDIPAIMTALQPLNPTGEFPYCAYEGPPLEPLFSRTRLDPILNKLSYVVQSAQQTYNDFPRDRLRRKLLGLKRPARGGFTHNSHGQLLPALHAYSAAISPAPADWPETTTVTGFWRLEDQTGWEPPDDFRAFLERGPAPIYLGFGSMPWGAQRNTEIITKALSIWGGRAVISQGWGGLKLDELPPTVYAIARAPHTKLFNHVKAVVHHGGAGTTYAGLYAGRPTFVVPQFFDQPYWGQRVYDLGCGPRPVRLRKLTPAILAQALEDLDTETSFAAAAMALREKLLLEDGTGRAVDVIEETIADYVPLRSNAAAAALRNSA